MAALMAAPPSLYLLFILIPYIIIETYRDEKEYDTLLAADS